MKSTLLILSLLFTSSVLFSQTKEGKTPVITIKALYGKTVNVENVTVTLLDVLEDSRCPTGTTCVWAGRAKILVEVIEKGQSPKQIEVVLGKKLPGENTGNIIFSNEALDITVIGLSPYPSVEGKIKKEDYVLQLLVD